MFRFGSISAATLLALTHATHFCQAWVAAETSAAPLSAVFDITEEQVMAVAAWRRQFASVFDVQDRMVASKGLYVVPHRLGSMVLAVC